MRSSWYDKRSLVHSRIDYFLTHFQAETGHNDRISRERALDNDFTISCRSV
jgi:hypothetical protein